MGSPIMVSRSKGRFQLGRPSANEAVADRAAQDVAFATFCYKCLRRHSNGDWGHIMSVEDSSRNQRAIEKGSRILSAYRQKDFPEIWIVTKADRSATKILFPYELKEESCYGMSHIRQQPDVSVNYCRADVSA
jgi:hypothetical protein